MEHVAQVVTGAYIVLIVVFICQFAIGDGYMNEWLSKGWFALLLCTGFAAVVLACAQAYLLVAGTGR